MKKFLVLCFVAIVAFASCATMAPLSQADLPNGLLPCEAVTWVHQNISYQSYAGHKQSVAQVMMSRRANCVDQSLFTAYLLTKYSGVKNIEICGADNIEHAFLYLPLYREYLDPTSGETSNTPPNGGIVVVRDLASNYF